MNRLANPHQPSGDFTNNLPQRHQAARLWQGIFRASTIIGIIALGLLLVNILNELMGYMAVENRVDPQSLAMDGVPLEEMSQDQLIQTLEENLSKNRYRTLEREKPLAERSQDELYLLVLDNVVRPKIMDTWTLYDSLFNKAKIEAQVAENYPGAKLQFRIWLNQRFITNPQDSDALKAGIRTAILGSLWTILITILFALPVGIASAVYLEEFAADTWVNRLIRTNINNLAGVPSIIYGMLGLAIFVRALGQLTSGAVFGAVQDTATANGRTILSAGLTLGLLVLPLLIINTQEAIRAVPNSLREAAFGVGATRWQTVWHHVLPNAISGILTGTILSISRAIGETAPLVVVGASTYISFDPTSPFSKFTTLPAQIYQWTARAQGEFHNLAAAAIFALLAMLLSLNALAILLRNRYSRRY